MDPVHKYKIYYSTQIRKKHKVFDEGIMEMDKNKIKIVDPDGNIIYSTFRPKNMKEDWSDPFTLGTYYSNFICVVPSLSC